MGPEKLGVGKTYETRITITEEMVENFARATGDYNPIHMDEDYARGTIFKTRVVHGMLHAGLISGIVEYLQEKNRLRLETVCVNQRGETAVTGEALVIPPNK